VFNEKVRLKAIVLIDINILNEKESLDNAFANLKKVEGSGRILSLETVKIGKFIESDKDFESSCLELLVANKASDV
jgi:hypothetical protein